MKAKLCVMSCIWFSLATLATEPVPMTLKAEGLNPLVARDETSQKTLKCKYEKKLPAGVKSYAVKKDGGDFSLEVTYLSGSVKEYALKAISGDEDYTEYQVVGGQHTGLQAVYIHEKFKWAKLIDNDGYSSGSCK